MVYRSKGSDRFRRGVAATELAIWLPFLALMFAVAIDYCRIYFATQTVQNCAAAGATYASGVSVADPAITSASAAVVQAALAEGVSLSPPLQQANVTTTTSGSSVQVTVTYAFPLLTQLPGLGGTVTITRSVTMTALPQPGS
jgi:Flp pilus assembly protein TadG